MNKKIKLNISIAGRNYPFSVYNVLEERSIREAAQVINDLISKKPISTHAKDKQDALAFVCLQCASEMIKMKLEQEQWKEKIENIQKQINKTKEN